MKNVSLDRPTTDGFGPPDSRLGGPTQHPDWEVFRRLTSEDLSLTAPLPLIYTPLLLSLHAPSLTLSSEGAVLSGGISADTAFCVLDTAPSSHATPPLPSTFLCVGLLSCPPAILYAHLLSTASSVAEPVRPCCVASALWLDVYTLSSRANPHASPRRGAPLASRQASVWRLLRVWLTPMSRSYRWPFAFLPLHEDRLRYYSEPPNTCSGGAVGRPR
ncbi:hypothetical protein C8Q78DRAFT_727311 [Trametes maxima]|nr:hypothetical protein C8Q78DRAFT_727311 [Trametes maxima]